MIIQIFRRKSLPLLSYSLNLFPNHQSPFTNHFFSISHILDPISSPFPYTNHHPHNTVLPLASLASSTHQRHALLLFTILYSKKNRCFLRFCDRENLFRLLNALINNLDFRRKTFPLLPIASRPLPNSFPFTQLKKLLFLAASFF